MYLSTNKYYRRGGKMVRCIQMLRKINVNMRKRGHLRIICEREEYQSISFEISGIK